MANNKFKAAVKKAKALYKTGRYKKFSDAVKAAYKKTPSRSKPKRRVAAVKKRRTVSAKPVLRTSRKTKATLAGVLSKAKAMVKDKLDSAVVRKYHAKGKRAKKKIQKSINDFNSFLRKFNN